MGVSLGHMMPTPFVMQAALALHEVNQLDQFVTTVYNNENSLFQQVIKSIGDRVGLDIRRSIQRRSIDCLFHDKIITYPWPEYFRMGIHRLFKNNYIDDIIFHQARDAFDAYFSRSINDTNVVYGYEYNSRKTFRRAKKHAKKIIYDVPSPEHDFVERILREEYSKYPELFSLYRNRVVDKHKKRTEYRLEEIDMADLVIANSKYSANSWKNVTSCKEKITYIHYGCPPVKCSFTKTRKSKKLQVLWAGTFGVRKGASYAIHAFNHPLLRKHAQLHIYGALRLPDSLLNEMPESIIAHDYVSRAELAEIMSELDVLLFPTLCDGFGMVVTEALANGMPVITTNQAGASELLDNHAGTIIQPASAQDIVKAIEVYINDFGLLEMQGIRCLDIASNNQWSHYRDRLKNIVSVV